MADGVDKTGDENVPLEKVTRGLDSGPRHPVGRLVEVADDKVEELTPDQRKREKMQLLSFVMVHYWSEIESGIADAQDKLKPGVSINEILEEVYKNVYKKVEPKMNSADDMAIRVMSRFAKVRDGEMSDNEAVVKTTQHVLKGMIQGAASVLYLADGLSRAFRAQYDGKISEDQIEEQLKDILKGKTFQNVVKSLGYSRGISMGAVFKGILQDGPNVRRFVGDHGADYSENLFDAAKLSFKNEGERVRLVVSPEVVRDIHGSHAEYKASSPSDTLVWGCPSGFARTADSGVILNKFSELMTELYCNTQLKKEKEPDSIRLIEAKPEDVSDQDLRALIENLIDFTLLPGSPYSKEDHIQGSIRTIKRAFEKGIVLAVKDGERTVGIAAAVSKKKMPDGRDLYELTKVSVLPEYRNKKIGSKLIEERLKLVREYFPDCPLATATRNPKAVSVYRRLGWKEASWGDESEIDLLIGGKKPDGSAGNGGPEWLKEWELMRDAKYKDFFFDPKAKR